MSKHTMSAYYLDDGERLQLETITAASFRSCIDAARRLAASKGRAFYPDGNYFIDYDASRSESGAVLECEQRTARIDAETTSLREFAALAIDRPEAAPEAGNGIGVEIVAPTGTAPQFEQWLAYCDRMIAYSFTAQAERLDAFGAELERLDAFVAEPEPEPEPDDKRRRSEQTTREEPPPV